VEVVQFHFLLHKLTFHSYLLLSSLPVGGGGIISCGNGNIVFCLLCDLSPFRSPVRAYIAE
jgi:hypothetical protein